MIKKELKQHLLLIKDIHDPKEKIEQIMIAGIKFFPFGRASIFTYSPLSQVGQGLIWVNTKGVHSMEISEDVRSVPLVLSVIQQKKPQYVNVDSSSPVFPEKYIQQFSLTSFLIIPLRHNQITVGCVFIDQFNKGLNDHLIHSLDQFFQQVTGTILEVTDPTQTKLSKRQLDVLQLLSNGYSTKEIADAMGISEFTARDYISTATKKLGASHRAEAVAISLRRGLIH